MTDRYIDNGLIPEYSKTPPTQIKRYTADVYLLDGRRVCETGLLSVKRSEWLDLVHKDHTTSIRLDQVSRYTVTQQSYTLTESDQEGGDPISKAG